MSEKIHTYWIAVLGSLTLMLNGCGATGGAMRGNASNPMETVVYAGMPASNLVETMGQPEEVRPADPPLEGVEIWVYRRTQSNVVYRPVTTEEIPYFDPLTGEYRPIVESVLQSETSRLITETQFLIVNGEVKTWKSNSEMRKRYD